MQKGFGIFFAIYPAPLPYLVFLFLFPGFLFPPPFSYPLFAVGKWWRENQGVEKPNMAPDSPALYGRERDSGAIYNAGRRESGGAWGFSVVFVSWNRMPILKKGTKTTEKNPKAPI